MDAYPMIERSLRLQAGWQPYPGCATCGHELDRQDEFVRYNCGWCGTENVAAMWLQPKMVDDQLVVEKYEWSYAAL